MPRFTLIAAALVGFALCLGTGASQAAPADFVASGWNGGDDGDYLKGTGQGVYLTGGARTVYRFRSLRTAGDRVLPFSPLWQSFHFVVRDDRNRHRVSFETSVRTVTDLYRGGVHGEVLYAFVELSPEGRWGNLKVGRQLRTSGGASGLVRFDGLAGRLELHHLLVETYAGAELRSRTFLLPEPGDEASHEIEANDDWVYGVVVGTAGLKTTQFRLGFHDRFHAGELARRTFTVDLHQALFGVVSLRSNLAADVLNRRVAEFLAGVDVRPMAGARVGVEFEHWHVVFDANNVFSVFATDPFDAIRGYGDFRLHSRVRLRTSGGVQVSPRALTQDEVPRDEVERVSGLQTAGLRVDLLDGLSLDLSERLVRGAGGTKFGLALVASIRPPGRLVDVRVRGDAQHYAYDLQPNLEGWYGGASAQLTVRPRGWVRASVTGEYIFSPWIRNNVRVTATLDFLLGGHLSKQGEAVLAGAASASVDRLQAGLLSTQLDPRTSNFSGLTGGLGLGGRVR